MISRAVKRLYKVKNDKLDKEVVLNARSVGNAMHLARKQEGWTHYGTLRYSGAYRNYTILRVK